MSRPNPPLNLALYTTSALSSPLSPINGQTVLRVTCGIVNTSVCPINYLYPDPTYIKVGMWVANVAYGVCFEIINIVSQTSTSIVMDVVDVDNYSGADGLGGLDPNTQGINTAIDTIVFELGDDGLPVLMEIDQFLTNQISNNFVTDLINRFRSRNYFTSYVRAYQASNTFSEGNFLTITSTGSYVLSTSSTSSVYNTVGVITSIGIPDTDWFTYRPFGQYLRGSRITPSLTGPSSGVGKIYYLTSTGSLTTTTPTSNPYPVYLQVSTGGDAILLKGQYGLQPSSGTGGSANFEPMFKVDFTTGLISIASSTGGNPQFIFDTNTSQLQLASGSSIGTVGPSDTVFIDANLNVYNSFTVDATSGISSFTAYTGGDLVAAIEIDPYSKQLIMMSGSSITSYNPEDTVFIDANLNVYNSMTVDAITGITSFVCYSGGNLVPAVEIDPCNKELIMMSGSSITSVNPEDTVFIDSNLNVYNSMTVDAITGITSFVCYSGSNLVPAVEIDPCNKELIMMSGSSITSVNPEDTVYIDANLNVYNSMTVDAITGITSFVCYSGSNLVPAVEIDPCNKELIMMSGSSITSINPGDTIFIDSNLNVYNSMTVDAITGITSFVCYSGSNLVPAVEIDPCNKELIMMSGSSITSINPGDTIFIDSNLNVYNSMTVDAITGITSFVCYSGSNLVPAVEIDPCNKELIMMSGSSITSVNPGDTVFIDSNLNVYNSMTVDAITGITSFVCYTGSDLVPSFEIDPCNKEFIMMTGTTIRSENPQDTVFIDGNFNSSNILTVDQVIGNIGINYYTGGNLIKNTTIDVYGNITSTGTSNITSIGTNNLIINNFSNNGLLSSPITINANRGRFGFSSWTSTGSTTVLVNNNRVSSTSSVFVNISNYYTSTTFPTILACIPSSGGFSILFSNNVGLSGNRFDIDFFIIN